MNSKNSKTYDPHRRIFNLNGKTHLKMSDECNALSNLSVYYTLKKIRSYTKTINLKYQLQLEMIILNCLMYHTVCQVFKIVCNTTSKKHETVTDNLPIRIM